MTVKHKSTKNPQVEIIRHALYRGHQVDSDKFDWQPADTALIELEEQLNAVTHERDALQSAAIRLCNVHRWSYGGPETLRALADRIAESYP